MLWTWEGGLPTWCIVSWLQYSLLSVTHLYSGSEPIPQSPYSKPSSSVHSDFTPAPNRDSRSCTNERRLSQCPWGVQGHIPVNPHAGTTQQVHFSKQDVAFLKLHHKSLTGMLRNLKVSWKGKQLCFFYSSLVPYIPGFLRNPNERGHVMSFIPEFFETYS